MPDQTLFKSFNNRNTIRKKETRTKIPKEELEIILAYIVSYNKMEIYKEQYKKKEDKELKLKWLRTALHVGNA